MGHGTLERVPWEAVLGAKQGVRMALSPRSAWCIGRVCSMDPESGDCVRPDPPVVRGPNVVYGTGG